MGRPEEELDTENIRQGAKLSKAVKTEAGAEVVNSIYDFVEKGIEELLTDEVIQPDKILEVVYACRGIVGALGEAGYKMYYARKVGERIAKERLAGV